MLFLWRAVIFINFCETQKGKRDSSVSNGEAASGVKKNENIFKFRGEN